MKLGFATKLYVEKTKNAISLQEIYVTLYCKCILVFLQNRWKNNLANRKEK